MSRRWRWLLAALVVVVVFMAARAIVASLGPQPRLLIHNTTASVAIVRIIDDGGLKLTEAVPPHAAGVMWSGFTTSGAAQLLDGGCQVVAETGFALGSNDMFVEVANGGVSATGVGYNPGVPLTDLSPAGAPCGG